MFSFFWSPQKTIDVKRERGIIGNMALGVASITFFTLVAQIVLVNALASVGISLSGISTTASLIINAITMYGIAMPLSMIYFKRCPVTKAEKKPLGFFTLIGLIAVCFALTYVGGIIGTLVEKLSAALVGREASNPVEETVSDISLGAIFLFMVVLAPILEEIFYRKVLIDRLRRYGDVPAIIISGLVFGLIHGNFSQFFYAALLGMVFGAIYVYTGKLRYTVFLHMLINFMGSFYITLMLDKLGGAVPEEITEEFIAQYPVGYSMMSASSTVYTVSLLLAIPALISFLRRLDPKKGAVTLLGEDRRRAVLANGGLWISLLFLVGYFALSLMAKKNA